MADVLRASAARELAAQLNPERVLVSGPAYDAARRLWNGAVDRLPSLIVRCQSPAEVKAAVLAARRHALPISVRGGGHDWAGRALRNDGLVIDLSRMRQVAVDPLTQTATVAGGATIGDVIAAAAPHELSAATGTVRTVGMTGLTLGGGYGPLCGRFGLALDNLLSVDMILADGRMVTADSTSEPELFWAVRGGGGNFGVVTQMRVRLHRVVRMLAGLILYPSAQATDVFAGLNSLLGAAPDELTVQSGLLSGPAGEPLLFLSPTWSGELAQGRTAIEPLLRLGTPVLSKVAPMSHPEMLGVFDAGFGAGLCYVICTRSVPGFAPEVISALVDSGVTRTSQLSAISIHHFHGAASRVPLESTAFGVRRDHLMIEIVASWEPADPDGGRHQAWTKSVSAALLPMALPGGYANLLGSEMDDQIAFAYGANAGRITSAKAQFDPDGIFSAIPLPLSVNQFDKSPGHGKSEKPRRPERGIADGGDASWQRGDRRRLRSGGSR